MSRKTVVEEDVVDDRPRGDLPVVAIVGRPNVGKSALFNRLIGEPLAIVEDQPGVTRDRNYADTTWNGREFTLVDTGGMVPGESEEHRIVKSILEHAQIAIDESSLVIFLVDAMEGIHALEEDIADMLRRSGKPVLLVANKVDNLKREVEIHEFHGLAIGQPWPVSAVHGIGTGDLLDEVVKALPADVVREEEEGVIRVAIVGRPNVGKSSLLNALLGEERAIVDSVPGTTRDPVDTRLIVDDQPFVLVDTAGLRRAARVDDKIEYYSSLRSHRAIKKCDIALLVVDAEEPASAQDKRIAGYVLEAAKAVIVIVNKWDLKREEVATMRDGPEPGVTDIEEARRQYGRDLFGELSFVAYAPVLFISAKTGEGVDGVFDLVRDVYDEFTRRIDTARLNKVVQEALMMRPPPSFKGQQLKVFYASQKDVKPPTFVFKVNSTKLLHFSYRRYLENHIRRAFGLMGTPIELILRK